MKDARHLPALLFLLFACAAAGPLVVRIVHIFPLYRDASVRDRTQVALQQISTDRGWILSDMELREVSDDGIIFLHREHRRAAPSPQCFSLSFSTSELVPCAE